MLPTAGVSDPLWREQAQKHLPLTGGVRGKMVAVSGRSFGSFVGLLWKKKPQMPGFPSKRDLTA